MDDSDLRSTVELIFAFIILSVSILVFAAYLVNTHEQTIRDCIAAEKSWTDDSCISVIK